MKEDGKLKEKDNEQSIKIRQSKEQRRRGLFSASARKVKRATASPVRT
jgi:hypothetical protein